MAGTGVWIELIGPFIFHRTKDEEVREGSCVDIELKNRDARPFNWLLCSRLHAKIDSTPLLVRLVSNNGKQQVAWFGSLTVVQVRSPNPP